MSDRDLPTLRTRLLELRRDVLGVLQCDGAAMGELALLASVQGALGAINAEAAEAVAPEPGERAVAVDFESEPPPKRRNPGKSRGFHWRWYGADQVFD